VQGIQQSKAHSTKSKPTSAVNQTKQRLGITCESNPSVSPDLNPIEGIWRTIKQRLKNRGVFYENGAYEEQLKKNGKKSLSQRLISQFQQCLYVFRRCWQRMVVLFHIEVVE
jgi:transposase